MHVHFDDTTVTLTATFGELRDLKLTDQKIWASVNTKGVVWSIYINATQSWRNDYVCAFPCEFEYFGIPFGGDEDMSEEELAAVADDEYSITISR